MARSDLRSSLHASYMHMSELIKYIWAVQGYYHVVENVVVCFDFYSPPRARSRCGGGGDFDQDLRLG